MIFGVYAIRDAKAGFLAPTLDQSGDHAIRNFEHAVMVTDSMFMTHPGDFSLWHIADYETDTGTLIPLVPPMQLVTADSLVKGVKYGEKENK